MPWPFDEWGRITRFLESGRRAFAREYELWSTLELGDRDAVKLSVTKPTGVYTVRVQQHLDAVADDQTFHAAVLLQTYALTEAAAADRLGVDARVFSGIEQWGTTLLEHAGAEWTDVKDGLPGAVELAVARNAFAHGTRTTDARAAKRLNDAGIRGRKTGTPVTLDYEQLVVFRSRLLSLLRAGEVGTPVARSTRSDALGGARVSRP